ncbi:MAG: hypothetical protein V1831_01320 [Candidatus Woesearchaeota archaeon]
MGVKLILFSLIVIMALFIVSCTSEPEIVPSLPAIYVVSSVSEEPSVKTYVIGEDDPLLWYDGTGEARHELNMARYAEEYEDDQEEFELKSKLSNVRRVVDNELIIGYDEELDNPRWVEVD